MKAEALDKNTSVAFMVKDVIRIEREALERLETSISDDVTGVLSSLLKTEGRIAVSGVGKAGLVGRKISATLASTGTKSYWLDPIDALHGDLGMVDKDDIAILLSNSGSSGEIILTAEALGNIGTRRIAMTRDQNTPLALMCEEVLSIGNHAEACPFNLAPTSSTTAMLALGDAIGITLQKLRGFTQNDYGLFHPAGALGRRLKKVHQCMRQRGSIALVKESHSIARAIHVITKSRCGLCIVIDDGGLLKGVFSDGDFRRCWERKVDFGQSIGSQMITECKSVCEDALVEDALEVMRSFRINALPVLGEDQTVVGLLDIQDVV